MSGKKTYDDDFLRRFFAARDAGLTVAELTIRFGKSHFWVRSRLKEREDERARTANELREGCGTTINLPKESA